MPEVFISYRREDTAASAGRLHDELALRLGAGHVFMDVDSIPAGEVFPRVIEERVAGCDAMLAMIGRSWLNCAGGDGKRRLDDPADFVRLEIAGALRRKIRVIPVLVDGAVLPAAAELPAELADLVVHQVMEISHKRFHRDAAEIAEAVGAKLPPATLPRAIGQELSRTLSTWLRLITDPKQFLLSARLDDAETLFFALRFLLYMTLAEALLAVARGSASGRVGHILSLTVGLNLQSAAAAFVLHAVMRAFGGKAPLQASIAAYCFVSAYLPLIDVLQNPVYDFAACIMQKLPAMPQSLMSVNLAALSAWTVATVLLSFALATLGWARMFRALFASYARLQQLRAGRAAVSFGLGLIAYAVFAIVFCGPFLQASYSSVPCPAEMALVFTDPTVPGDATGQWLRANGSPVSIVQSGNDVTARFDGGDGQPRTFSGVFQGNGARLQSFSETGQPTGNTALLRWSGAALELTVNENGRAGSAVGLTKSTGLRQ